MSDEDQSSASGRQFVHVSKEDMRYRAEGGSMSTNKSLY